MRGLLLQCRKLFVLFCVGVCEFVYVAVCGGFLWGFFGASLCVWVSKPLWAVFDLHSTGLSLSVPISAERPSVHPSACFTPLVPLSSGQRDECRGPRKWVWVKEWTKVDGCSQERILYVRRGRGGVTFLLF